MRFHNGFSNIFVSFLGCCHTYIYVCIIDIVLYMCGHGIHSDMHGLMLGLDDPFCSGTLLIVISSIAGESILTYVQLFLRKPDFLASNRIVKF